jgi:hypothetical protein
MTYTMKVDGAITSEKWLGDNAIERYFKVSTQDRTKAATYQITIEASLD